MAQSMSLALDACLAVHLLIADCTHTNPSTLLIQTLPMKSLSTCQPLSTPSTRRAAS